MRMGEVRKGEWRGSEKGHGNVFLNVRCGRE